MDKNEEVKKISKSKVEKVKVAKIFVHDCEAMCESHAVPEMKLDQQSSSLRAGAGSRQLTNSRLTDERETV